MNDRIPVGLSAAACLICGGMIVPLNHVFGGVLILIGIVLAWRILP